MTLTPPDRTARTGQVSRSSLNLHGITRDKRRSVYRSCLSAREVAISHVDLNVTECRLLGRSEDFHGKRYYSENLLPLRRAPGSISSAIQVASRPR